MKTIILSLLLAVSLAAAEPAMDLLNLAKKSANSPEFKTALGKIIKDGRGISGVQGDFLFAAEAKALPTLTIDDAPGTKFTRVKGSDLWFALAKVSTGTGHNYAISIDGKSKPAADFAAFGPDSYEQPGVPQGKLSEKIVHTSKVYPGMVSDYWIYVPAQYDPQTAAPLFVVQDGQGYARRDSNSRLITTLDNLTHQKTIPVMITVFISPGLIGERRMRSVQLR